MEEAVTVALREPHPGLAPTRQKTSWEAAINYTLGDLSMDCTIAKLQR